MMKSDEFTNQLSSCPPFECMLRLREMNLPNQDYCCATDCSPYNGVRECTPYFIPAKRPNIIGLLRGNLWDRVSLNCVRDRTAPC